MIKEFSVRNKCIHFHDKPITQDQAVEVLNILIMQCRSTADAIQDTPFVDVGILIELENMNNVLDSIDGMD